MGEYVRRPAVMISALFGAGIFLAFHLKLEIVYWIIIFTCGLAFFVWTKISRKIFVKSGGCVLVITFIFGGLYLSASDIKTEFVLESYGAQISVSGIITEVKDKGDFYSFTIRNENSSFLVNCYGDKSCLSVGERVCVTGEKSEVQGRRNPGCFDYNLYLKSCGIDGVIDAYAVDDAEGRQIPFLKAVSKLRSEFDMRLADVTDDETKGVITALMFGDKGGLNENIYEEFQKNGTAHILAVSGMHIGIIYGFFISIWKWRKGTVFYLSILAVLLMYMALASFSPSVVRAAIMITIHIIANICHRKYDLLSAASVTFFVMLIIEPFQLFNAGFQLSFMAVTSLGVILPYIKKVYNGIFLVPLAVQLSMTPYTAFLFNCISVPAVFANIPAVLLAGVLLPLGICMFASMALPETVFEFTAYVMEAGCDLLIRINRMFYADGGLSIDVVSPEVWVLVLHYGLIILFFSEAGQLLRLRRKYKYILVIFIVIIIAAVSIDFIMYNGFENAVITFVDVGQGDCIHIRTREGRNYLVDTGGSTAIDTGSRILKPYLLKNGVKKVDAVFVTHMHEDHFGGVRALDSSGMVEQIGVYEANKYSTKLSQENVNAEIIYLYAGQRIILGNNVYLEVIFPYKESASDYKEMLSEEDDENKACLIFKLYYEEMTVLFTGDIDKEGEAALISACRDDLDSDILKVPHHGSKYSSSEEFINAVNPDVAVIQVGKNLYGHPHADTINRYNDAGCRVFRNDNDGAIGIKTERKGTVKVVNMID